MLTGPVDPSPPEPSEIGAHHPIVGYCDGVHGAWIHGWAWRPERPEDPVEIELSVDGTVVGTTMATLDRDDLREAGIGHGRYGWSLRFPDEPGRVTPLQVVARALGGAPLTNGVFEHRGTPPGDDVADPSIVAEQVEPAPPDAITAIDSLGPNPTEIPEPNPIVGYCDGIHGTWIYGWAWRPNQPDDPVEIEVSLDGIIVGTTLAALDRDDLRDAGIGDGRHGWRLPFPDQPGRAAPLQVVARTRGGAPLTNGVFEHRGTPTGDDVADPSVVATPFEPARPDAAIAIDSPPTDAPEPNRIVGYCDGVRGASIHGWAWRPEQPDEDVDIEVSIDGIVVGTMTASLYRADLRVAGIGHGRYGWRLPFPDQPGRVTPLQVVARARDGTPLINGVFEHSSTPPPDDIADPVLQSFAAAGLASARPPASKAAERAAPITHFLVHNAVAADSRSLGAAEYSYGFLTKAFLPLLERIGCVHVLDGTPEGVEALVADHRARGEAGILLSFAPPHKTPLDLRCPIVPVVAWEYPTLPDRPWNGDARNDWRTVLRQTGRMIVLSRYLADAVRAAMGPDFPVAVIPTPVWDRFPNLHRLTSPPPTSTVEIDGFVFDTRGRSFGIDGSIPRPPAPDGTGSGERFAKSVKLEGIVLTTVLAPLDGRKNWGEIITAFLAAHGKDPGATLVMKMICVDPAQWWWDLHEILGRQPAFVCRLVILHGFLDEAHYNKLIAASHWVVNASRAEGQCLPLLEFMCASRPAIAPSHTSMADYIKPSNALLIETSEEFCSTPLDPTNMLNSVRHRVSWESLVAVFGEATRLVRDDPAGYQALADDAGATMRSYCSDEIVAARLDSFLGLGLGLGQRAPTPSSLLNAVAAAI